MSYLFAILYLVIFCLVIALLQSRWDLSEQKTEIQKKIKEINEKDDLISELTQKVEPVKKENVNLRIKCKKIQEEIDRSLVQKKENDIKYCQKVVENYLFKKEFEKLYNEISKKENQCMQLYRRLKNKDDKEANDQKKFWDGKEITDEFSAVETAIRNNVPCLFVHGGAGTGKSTLIQYLSEMGLIQVRLAPTGLAALNIQGRTIHSFFKIPVLPLYVKNTFQNVPKESEAVLQHTPWICIDEISMVRADLMDYIDRQLCMMTQNYKLPFGGYHLLFVGDLYQLSPIISGVKRYFDPRYAESRNDGWKSPWFFDAECFQKLHVPMTVIELTHVFRQRDAEFIKDLNMIRNYSILPTRFDRFISEIEKSNTPPEDAVCLTTKNAAAKNLNEKKMSQIAGHTFTHSALMDDTMRQKDLKSTDIPAEVELKLKIGAKVIMLVNDVNREYVNGSIGTVIEIEQGDPSIVKVRLSSNERVIEITPYLWQYWKTVWDTEKKEYVDVPDGAFIQYPLQLAYALTIHKSQGKTLDRIYVKGEIFTSGQLYVALSRVKKKEGIVLDRNYTRSSIRPDPRLLEVFVDNVQPSPFQRI